MTDFFHSPYTGEEISVQTIKTRNVSEIKNKFWKCKICGYIWKGHDKLHLENRKPIKCSRCGRMWNVVSVTLKHGKLESPATLMKSSK